VHVVCAIKQRPLLRRFESASLVTGQVPSRDVPFWEARPEPLVVVVRPATRVTGVLVDHLRQPVPFTTVRVIRVQDFTGWFRKGAFAIAEGPTDNEGRFQFELPSHETNARYAIKVMTQRATAPLVFLCRGNCDSAMPFGLRMSSSPPDVRLSPAGGESFDVGEIQCLASATVSLQVVSTGHPPPYKIWLTPAGVNRRSFSVVTGGTDGTGLATFEGLAPGAARGGTSGTTGFTATDRCKC
jgi:hypothetical protein